MRYCTGSGDEVATTVGDVDAAAVAAGSPVREFGWRRRQRNYPGWLCIATTGSLVGCESLLERDRILLADFDTRVVGIASQPFWVSGRDGTEQRRHVPDYLLSLRDGSVVVVDVKPAAMCQEPEVAAVLDWTGRLCRSRGWRYEVSTVRTRSSWRTCGSWLMGAAPCSYNRTGTFASLGYVCAEAT